MTTHYLDVYAINDDDESDADSILYTTAHDTDTLRRALIDAMGNVTLDFLFHDDLMHNDAYNVRNADDDVIAVAYIGNE
jgi:hypothetical protein